MEHEHGILRMTRSDAVGGGLLGMLVGDALGVPYEFSPPDRIPKSERIEMAPPAGFQRAHPWTPPGTWSDDGAQALCLLASLLHCSGLDLGDFGNRLVNWLDLCYRSVGEIGRASCRERVRQYV